MNTQTQTSARRHESGFFADMILDVTQAGRSTQVDIMANRARSRSRLVPNILLIGGGSTGNTTNTGNTVIYQWVTAVGVQTNAGGEGISARVREHSLVLSRIESFIKLPKDWGGEDTILVDRQTLDLAKRLVRELPKKWPLPQVTSSPDGEIAFTWFKGENRLEALLQPDHHLIWVVKNNGQYAPGRDIDLGAVASFAGLFEAIARLYL
jgi:hypothetical protein